jgi:hypothetical protein
MGVERQGVGAVRAEDAGASGLGGQQPLLRVGQTECSGADLAGDHASLDVRAPERSFVDEGLHRIAKAPANLLQPVLAVGRRLQRRLEPKFELGIEKVALENREAAPQQHVLGVLAVRELNSRIGEEVRTLRYLYEGVGSALRYNTTEPKTGESFDVSELVA